MLRDRPRLVGLQAADEMPAQRQVLQLGHLRQRFLQVALAEGTQARRRRGPQRCGRVALADSQYCDAIDTPARACGGRSRAFAHIGDTLQ